MSSLLCLAVVFSVVTCTELKLMTLSKPEKIRKAIELLNSLGSDDEPQPSQAGRRRSEPQFSSTNSDPAVLRQSNESQRAAVSRHLEHRHDDSLQPGPSSNTLSPSWQRQSCTRELSSSSRPGNSSRGNEGMY